MEPVNPEPNQKPGKVKLDPRVIHFLIGFTGWSLMFFLFWPMFYGGGAFFILIINLLAIIYLAFHPKTRWIALGMLTAMAVNLMVSLVLGVIFNALCSPFFGK